MFVCNGRNIVVSKEKAFKIELLNNRLREINFDCESSNDPLAIDIDCVKRNRKLQMSASESLFFTRYFCVIVGDSVDQKSKMWQLYIGLRKIVDIWTILKLTNSDLLRLEQIITEHHDLYKKHYGELKAKFHFLLHYVRSISRNGPPMKTDSIRFESKHQDVKKIILASHSKKNLCKL